MHELLTNIEQHDKKKLLDFIQHRKAYYSVWWGYVGPTCSTMTTYLRMIYEVKKHTQANDNLNMSVFIVSQNCLVILRVPQSKHCPSKPHYEVCCYYYTNNKLQLTVYQGATRGQHLAGVVDGKQMDGAMQQGGWPNCQTLSMCGVYMMLIFLKIYNLFKLHWMIILSLTCSEFGNYTKVNSQLCLSQIHISQIIAY